MQFENLQELKFYKNKSKKGYFLFLKMTKKQFFSSILFFFAVENKF